MKDKVVDMLINSSNVECWLVSLEDVLECVIFSVLLCIKECNLVFLLYILLLVVKVEVLDNS